MGRLECIEKGLAYMAGYGVSAYLITQDTNQLYATYGQYETITSNCIVRVAFAPDNVDTAKQLSWMLGEKTLEEKQTSYSGHRFSWLLKHRNVSTHKMSRALLTADELRRLPENQALIFKRGLAPILGEKIKYYLDEEFSERAKVKPVKSDKISQQTVWDDCFGESGDFSLDESSVDEINILDAHDEVTKELGALLG